MTIKTGDYHADQYNDDEKRTNNTNRVPSIQETNEFQQRQSRLTQHKLTSSKWRGTSVSKRGGGTWEIRGVKIHAAISLYRMVNSLYEKCLHLFQCCSTSSLQYRLGLDSK